jgi:hypothetical protein
LDRRRGRGEDRSHPRRAARAVARRVRSRSVAARPNGGEDAAAPWAGACHAGMPGRGARHAHKQNAHEHMRASKNPGIAAGVMRPSVGMACVSEACCSQYRKPRRTAK